MTALVKPMPSIPRLTYSVTGDSVYSSEKVSYVIDFGDKELCFLFLSVL